MKKYDVQKKSQAAVRLTFRAVVSFYLLYLAGKILGGAMAPDSTMAVWMGAGISLAFAAAAVIFGIYSWKNYKQALKDAQLPEEETKEED